MNLHLLFFATLLPVMTIAADTISKPRVAKELADLRAGDTFKLPETRLDRPSGFPPFSGKAVEGRVPGARGCFFTLYDTRETTIVSALTDWTITKVNTNPRATTVVVKDAAGNKGRFYCRVLANGSPILNIDELQKAKASFVLKDEVLPTTASKSEQRL